MLTVNLGAGIGGDGDSDSLTCVANVVSNLVGSPNIQLMRDGTQVDSTASSMLSYSLSDKEAGMFTCRVCINVSEAGIQDHCNETEVLVNSREGIKCNCVIV